MDTIISSSSLVSKLMYKILGFLFVGLATLGVVLPVLPTTPFLLLAAGCFARSSKRWYNWLLTNPTFGKMIKNWNEKRCVMLKSKILALTMIILFGGCSVFVALDNIYLQCFTALLLFCGIFVVARLKVCPQTTD